MMKTSTEQSGIPAGTDATTANGSVQQQVSALVGSRAIHDAFDWFTSHVRHLSDLQLEVTAIPAPPFGEANRAAWAKSQFEQAGLEKVHIDAAGNVLGIRRGIDPNAKYVILSAHLDTIFPPETKLEVRREGDKLLGPGISDNSAGLIAMLAIAAAMQETGLRTKGPILFVANVGEEGEGDLRGMRHLFSDPQWKDLSATHWFSMVGALTASSRRASAAGVSR